MISIEKRNVAQMTSTTPAAASAALPDPRELRLFDQLYELRSVTRAAQALGQSQPTVSIWLARLRRRFDDPLFVRTPAGMQPTPRAESLVGPLRAALHALQQLGASEARFAPQVAARRFRVCMTDASHITLLPLLLAHLRLAAPQVQLVVSQIGADTAAALQAGQADLAIGHVPWLDAGFYQQALYAQDWVCLASAGHPRIRKSLSLAAYRAEGHVGIAGGTGALLLEQALQAKRVSRRVVLEMPGFLGLGAIIARSDLLATVPRHIGETLAVLNKLAVLPCPVLVPGFVVKQHWHARYHHDDASRWLRGVCAELFQQRHPAGKPVLRKDRG